MEDKVIKIMTVQDIKTKKKKMISKCFNNFLDFADFLKKTNIVKELRVFSIIDGGKSESKDKKNS